MADPEVTQADLDLVTSQVSEALNSVARNIATKLQEMAKTIEITEQTLATLVMGFAEQTIVIEALTSQLAFSNEEERKAFTDSIENGRKQMFKMMQETADGMAETDPDTASTLERLVEENQASAPS